MKIKFLKPFRLYNPIGDDMTMDEGAIDNMEKEDYAKWLIDNGFAEEVKESSWWKPKLHEKYLFLSNAGEIIEEPWLGCMVNEFRYSIGNCFKTDKAAERYRDYLKAIVTVRQDEGVLTPEQVAENSHFYFIRIDEKSRLRVHAFDAGYVSANAFSFGTREHAQASLDKHPDEWKIITNYDWNRE